MNFSQVEKDKGEMSELEELKERAVKRREEAATWKYDDGGRAPTLHEEAEADLDRAIAIAESHLQAVLDAQRDYIGTQRERDKARALAKQLHDAAKFDDNLTDALAVYEEQSKGWT